MQVNEIKFSYQVPGDDFTRAGEASSDVKAKLRSLGLDPAAIRRVAIAMYEGEINLVIHAGGGEIDVSITPEQVYIEISDSGPGIEDVEQAMREGYSTAGNEARGMGFGAGMGLPNMKKYTDSMTVSSKPGIGTTVCMAVNLV